MQNLHETLSYSVVIPARNAARTLAACLDAVFTAQPAPTEVIVVNDASEEGKKGSDPIRGLTPLLPGKDIRG